MNIGLDWDGVCTSAPKIYLNFAKEMREAGHKVYIVTMRYPSEWTEIPLEWSMNVDGIYCTGRLAKRPFMLSRGITIHNWIDDHPEAIDKDAKDIWPSVTPEGTVYESNYA